MTLFHQDALLREPSSIPLRKSADATKEIGTLLLIDAPLVFESKLFNCARRGMHRGKILGVTPKI